MRLILAVWCISYTMCSLTSQILTRAAPRSGGTQLLNALPNGTLPYACIFSRMKHQKQQTVLIDIPKLPKVAKIAHMSVVNVDMEVPSE